MAGRPSMIRLQIDVPESEVMTQGIQHVLENIRLTDDGRVIVPLDSDNDSIRVPEPCGIWERWDSPLTSGRASV